APATSPGPSLWCATNMLPPVRPPRHDHGTTLAPRSRDHLIVVARGPGTRDAAGAGGRGDGVPGAAHGRDARGAAAVEGRRGPARGRAADGRGSEDGDSVRGGGRRGRARAGRRG